MPQISSVEHVREVHCQHDQSCLLWVELGKNDLLAQMLFFPRTEAILAKSKSETTDKCGERERKREMSSFNTVQLFQLQKTNICEQHPFP